MILFKYTKAVRLMEWSPINLASLPEKVTMAKTSHKSRDLWLPFWVHSMDTAYAMQFLLQNWVSKAEKRRLRETNDTPMTSGQMYQLGRFLALVHDLGKVSMEFQMKITRNYPGRREAVADAGLSMQAVTQDRNHALLSQKYLNRDNHEELPGVLAAACIVGAHHGKPPEEADPVWTPNDPDGSWETMQNRWMDYALSQSGYSDRKALLCPSQTAQVLWIGLLIMADWIASNPYYFPLIGIEEDGSKLNLENRGMLACRKLNLTHPWMPEECWDCDLLYQDRFGFAPNEIQNMVSKAVQETQAPGILILEAQMGTGKTEAALAAAEMIAAKTMHSGVYFGLPTQATANGIFGRLKSWVKRQSVQENHTIRLAHGAAELNEEYHALLEGSAETQDEEIQGKIQVNEWFSGRKQALLADFVIGTVDQLLMAGLRQKHVMLRHLGLGNKIVIVDECHAYDAYMNEYLETVLRWLGAYQVPVILLSATLPAERRRDMVLAYQNRRLRKGQPEPWMSSCAYPLLTWTDGKNVRQNSLSHLTVRQEVRWNMAPWEAEDFTSLALDLKERLKDGGCAGVIVNTVHRAQNCAKQLRCYFPEEEIRVIHAQYLMPDRALREKELVDLLGKKSRTGNGRPDRLIVVGTQVLEQSLDIDFDYLVTDLCPMDLLLQRIGRLHRHLWRTRPTGLQQAACQILCTAAEDPEPGAEAVYGGYLLMRTREILRNHGSLRLPGDISLLVQKTYDPGWDPETESPAYQAAKEKDCRHRKDQRCRADTYCLPAPENDPDEEELGQELYNWLGTACQDGKAMAAVRDGDPSVDVLCLRWGPDGKLYFMNDTAFQRPLSPDCTPSEEEAMEIARQRLRLPHRLCVSYRINQTVEQLEQQTMQMVGEWQYSKWLHGELFLIFETNGTARIGNLRMRYSFENGLETEKEEP